MLIAVLASAGVIHAQTSHALSARARVRVTLVLVNSLSSNEEFRIVRRAVEEPHDVILLTDVATSGTLSAAVQDLLSVRAQQGDTARLDGIVRIRHSGQISRRMLPWAERVLSDLRRARPRSIPGFGTLPAVDIWLPPQRRAPAR